MPDIGITANITFNSYSAGINTGLSNSLNYYSLFLPVKLGYSTGLGIVSDVPIVSFYVLLNPTFSSFYPSIGVGALGILSLPFAPVSIGFNQSIEYLSFINVAPINLIDVFGLPLIEYFLGFNQQLDYQSNYSVTASQTFTLKHLSFKPVGLIDSLAELLGLNYSQDINEIRIKTSDLFLSDASKAQNILVAIIFNALGAFMFSKTMKAELWGIKIINDTRYAAIVVTKTELE